MSRPSLDLVCFGLQGYDAALEFLCMAASQDKSPMRIFKVHGCVGVWL